MNISANLNLYRKYSILGRESRGGFLKIKTSVPLNSRGYACTAQTSADIPGEFRGRTSHGNSEAGNLSSGDNEGFLVGGRLRDNKDRNRT